jgi:hypothetical protein
MKTYEKYYNRYGLNHPGYNVTRIAGSQIRDRAAHYFSGDMLEIGCGEKTKSLLVGEFVDEHVGLDHPGSPHDHSNIDIYGTAYSIPVSCNSYDCVLSTSVLHGLHFLFENSGFRIIEITPLSGYWITSSTVWAYYLQKFRRGAFKYLVDVIVMFNNLFFPILDQGILRDERFSWMYIAVVCKPEE